MTVRAQDDHLIAGAWAAFDRQTRHSDRPMIKETHR